MKSDKVDIVKRIIRQNSYHQYDKSHAQCIELGINIDRIALDRFADKLELIDRAELSKKQNEIKEIEQAQGRTKRPAVNTQMARNTPQQQQSVSKPPTVRKSVAVNPPTGREHPVNRLRPAYQVPELTYEEVKQREAEITFELGELKIRESELLQELITLSQMLDDSQFN